MPLLKTAIYDLGDTFKRAPAGTSKQFIKQPISARVISLWLNSSNVKVDSEKMFYSQKPTHVYTRKILPFGAHVLVTLDQKL